jgi:hypothetical protein
MLRYRLTVSVSTVRAALRLAIDMPQYLTSIACCPAMLGLHLIWLVQPSLGPSATSVLMLTHSECLKFRL